MKKLNKKTKLRIGIVSAIVLVAVAAVIAYFLLVPKEDASSNVASEVPLSETPNLSACALTTPEKLKNSELAGGNIISVGEGTRVGIKSPDGSTADACRYSFTTKASEDNTITIAAYAAVVRTDTNPTNSADYSWSQAAGTSPQMYFAEKKNDDEKRVIDIVQQPLGGTVLLLTIDQPTDALTFPKGAAQWYLADIAKSADVEALEKAANKSAGTDTSDGPGTPPSSTKVETLKPEN